MNNLDVRRALPSDSNSISLLIREGFGSWVAERTIYGCPGIDRYLEALIAARAFSSSQYMVAELNGVSVGCAELRRDGRDLFLGYIAVAEEARGAGVGGSLLRTAVSLSASAQPGEMVLDVFEDNEPAVAWYKRLGFEERDVLEWWECGLGDRAGTKADEEGTVSGVPEANVCHVAHGFSQLCVQGATGSYMVGRLGERWWRVTDLAILDDRTAMAVLGSVGPDRRILAVGRAAGPGAGRVGAPVRRSRRMAMDLATLAGRLGA